MKVLLLMLIFTSCAMPLRKQVLVDVEAHQAGPATRADRVLACVDKYKGEGFKASYGVCKDLYTLE